MKQIAALLVILQSVCWAGSQIDLLRQELKGLDLNHPEADAERDIASGSPHCYSVNGYGVSFPSVETQKARDYCLRIERNFAGTSDAVESQEHVQLIEEARAYAAAYNQVILAHQSEP